MGDRLWIDTNANGVQDPGETGITGATVQLFDGGDNLIATTTTAADGIYHFDNLVNGTYTVKVVPSTLPAGVAPTYDLDGAASAHQATFTLGGTRGRRRLRLPRHRLGRRPGVDRHQRQRRPGRGRDGPQRRHRRARRQRQPRGRHRHHRRRRQLQLRPSAGRQLLRPRRRLVAAGRSGCDLRPRRHRDRERGQLPLDAGASRTDVDFGYRYTGSIGDRIWLDANANGVQDAGEAGINGVTVELLDNAGSVVATATTSGDGSYTFNNLAGGNYTVRVVASSLPTGVAETYDLDGVASANQATFTLAAGANRTDVDFGYRHTGSIGDRIWLDANANGAQDAGEAGINGVTVELLDSANHVVATDTTTGDGNYHFDNLAAGSYTVRIVNSSLPEGVAETYDLDGVASARPGHPHPRRRAAPHRRRLRVPQHGLGR